MSTESRELQPTTSEDCAARHGPAALNAAQVTAMAQNRREERHGITAVFGAVGALAPHAFIAVTLNV